MNITKTFSRCEQALSGRLQIALILIVTSFDDSSSGADQDIPSSFQI